MSKDNNETENDEPEAMIVEIEDDSCESVQPVSSDTPLTQMPIPIFKFDFANRDSRYADHRCKPFEKVLSNRFHSHEPADCIRVIKDVMKVFENANNSILDIYKTNEVSITSIKVSVVEA